MSARNDVVMNLLTDNVLDGRAMSQSQAARVLEEVNRLRQERDELRAQAGTDQFSAMFDRIQELEGVIRRYVVETGRAPRARDERAIDEAAHALVSVLSTDAEHGTPEAVS